MYTVNALLPVFVAASLLFSFTAAQSATIPEEEEDTCISFLNPVSINYTCTSNSNDTILWRVATAQIRNFDFFESEGISVNNSDDFLSSSITITQQGRQFVIDAIDMNSFVVSCLTEQNSINVVEGDNRRVTIYSAPPPPENVILTPTAVLLVYRLEWSRPQTVPDCAPVNYMLTVTNLVTGVTELDSEGITGDIALERESYLYNDTESDMCELHQFSLVSVNDAGTSPSTAINETIPISPIVGPINSSLTAVPLLDDGVKIGISFMPAISCNDVLYPVVNYIITIPGLSGSLTVPHTGASVSVNLTTANFPGLEDNMYTVNVVACASFACRSAEPVTVVTSGVQSANATFLNTTVSLVCVFAETSSTTGCRFQLSLPEDVSETLDLQREGVVTQQCGTTQNMREAYLDIEVVALDSAGHAGSFPTNPDILVTEDVADISPCEPPTPEIMVEVVEESKLSAGEIAAIIIAVLVVFVVLITVLVIIVWWRRQDLRTVYKNWVHTLGDDEGIDLMVREEQPNKPTIMMLMKNLVPGPDSSTTTLPRKKGLTREYSQQPDMAVEKTNEDEVALRSRYAEPSSPPACSGKEPVAGIKVKDPSDPNSLQLVLKPAMLANVVRKWKSKVKRGAGAEMLLYWKEDEEDVDDDEPYYVDPEEENL